MPRRLTLDELSDKHNYSISVTPAELKLFTTQKTALQRNRSAVVARALDHLHAKLGTGCPVTFEQPVIGGTTLNFWLYREKPRQVAQLATRHLCTNRSVIWTALKFWIRDGCP